MIKIKNTSKNTAFYATPYSAGFDICANILEDTPWPIPARSYTPVPTGLYIDQEAIKPGLSVPFWWPKGAFQPIAELQIRARSGLAMKFGISLLNGVGTVDWDYPDEIKILLMNHTDDTFFVYNGDRIAQGVVALVARAGDVEIKTDTRTGGFGSTGK